MACGAEAYHIVPSDQRVVFVEAVKMTLIIMPRRLKSPVVDTSNNHSLCHVLKRLVGILVANGIWLRIANRRAIKCSLKHVMILVKWHVEAVDWILEGEVGDA
jgi:hypothetical protein